MELKGSKTEANLMAAFAGESQARNKYDYYASRAKKDGYEQIAAIFKDIAFKFRKVAEVEAQHEARYRKLAANIESGEVWVRVGKNKWQCRNCGAIVESETAPEKCPVCDHPRAYFQLEQDNF